MAAGLQRGQAAQQSGTHPPARFAQKHRQHDLALFNRKLADWLVFYNAERPHHTLGQRSPLSFLLQHQPECQRYWTHTHHTGPIKTPKQLMWVSLAAFVVPIFVIIGIVKLVVHS